MGDHRSIPELDQGLGEGEGERAETGAEATDEDEGCNIMSAVWRLYLKRVVAHPSSLRSIEQLEYQLQSLDRPRKLLLDQFQQLVLQVSGLGLAVEYKSPMESSIGRQIDRLYCVSKSSRGLKLALRRSRTLFLRSQLSVRPCRPGGRPLASATAGPITRAARFLFWFQQL